MNKDAVILIPCYDPNEKIMQKFVFELEKSFENIVFVDDGCNKKHAKYFEKLAKNHSVIKHNINLGKGRGIKNGINYILNNYPSAKVIVTADCDGQHSVKDIKKCYEVAFQNQDSFVLGCRDIKKMPLRSKLGNTVTKNILYNLIGNKISDTQTGLRAMSFDVAKKLIEVPGERYEYETNVLMATRKKNIPIVEVSIDTIYIENNETSHFNPVKDSIRIYKFFAKYLLVIFIAYLLECYLFSNTYILSNGTSHIILALFTSKVLSSLFIVIFNKNVNYIYTIINFLIEAIILSMISKYIVLVKVIIDIIMFILNILFTKFKTNKIK